MKRSFSKTRELYSPNSEDSVDSSSKAKKKKKKHKEKVAETPDSKRERVEDYDESMIEIDSEGERTDEQTPRKKKKKKKKHRIKKEVDDVQDFENFEEELQNDFEEKYSLSDSKAISNEEPHPNGLLNKVWPKDKVIQLINRIKEAIPAGDTLKYTSRLSKLDWNFIAFDEYSGPECEEMWKQIQEKCRCYRVLNDIVCDAETMLLQPSSSFYESLKMAKDPELPAKPLSSFMLFYMDTKDKVQKEHAGLSGTDVAKRVGEIWKTLNPKKKQNYSDRAQELRKKYDEKLEQFFQNHPEYYVNKQKKRSSKNKKSALGFEKPKTAFQLYFQSYRDSYDHKLKHLSDKELYENSKVEWKSMAEWDKVPWIEAAQKEEELYRENLRKYESEHPGFIPPTVKTIITKNERHVLENCAGKPKKPPNNAYSLYSRKMLQGNVLKDLPAKERFTEISERWKVMGQSEKEKYAKELEKLQAEYAKKYSKYLDSLSPQKREEEEALNKPKKKKSSSSTNSGSKKVVLEPEKPLTNVIELFKLKHQHEWKSNAKMSVAEMVKKKWEKLKDSQKKGYIEELKELNTEYERKFLEYMKHCPADKTMDVFNKLMRHRQELTRHLEQQNIEETDSDTD